MEQGIHGCEQRIFSEVAANRPRLSMNTQMSAPARRANLLNSRSDGSEGPKVDLGAPGIGQLQSGNAGNWILEGISAYAAAVMAMMPVPVVRRVDADVA